MDTMVVHRGPYCINITSIYDTNIRTGGVSFGYSGFLPLRTDGVSFGYSGFLPLRKDGVSIGYSGFLPLRTDGVSIGYSGFPPTKNRRCFLWLFWFSSH